MPSNSKPSRKPNAPRRQPTPPRSTAQPELVDPAFILKGLAATLAAALILAYLTLCIVYVHSAWQLILHPSRTVTTTPASQGLPFTEVHFGVDASGQPQLDGWWIPANAPDTAFSQPEHTVLMLHGASGTMADALAMAATLHSLRLNVLLFDYRGYGRSGSQHPTQDTMQADAHSALDYLLNQRSLSVSSIVVYGHDLGAPLALNLCATDTVSCPSLILDAPDGDTLPRAAQDARSRAVPALLLFHQRFPLAAPLAASSVPKLLVLHSNNPPPEELRNAHDPKTLLAVQPGDDTSLKNGIQRFLDEYSR
ncbi:alpha/beta fold hydrolase [Granulicella sp. 5B5]|uniref:alpha/beta hydrolase n=1 Tax=Granulicella sp. 5B5 TaxID=1617967 RepID=UPI0015F3F1D4|nr:alpha/beta fold hydrolase [Granulicella sp. 5B5]